MRSSLNSLAFAACLCLATIPSQASAQSDAEIAFQNARTAFAGERFEAARDLLESASQTDAGNPDVFLLLGKAHYQLGDVDAAIGAWQRTLKLAPARAYARRMVDTLQGKIRDADVRIEVVRSLLDERQTSLALTEIGSLKRLSLSGPQLAQLLLLEAEAIIQNPARINPQQAGSALKALRELAVRDPQQSATARVRLLTGKAKLALGGDSDAEGLGILAAVKTEFADDVEGAAADLALIAFRIDQGEAVVDELAAWITANDQHPDLPVAQQTMTGAVEVFLKVAVLHPPTQKGEDLSAVEISALEAAEHALSSMKDADLSLELTRQLVSHFQRRWIAGGSYTTANTALERLLKLDLPASSRTELETLLASSRNAAASEQLDSILVALHEGDGLPETLATWIETYARHPRVVQARLQLVSAYLERTRRGGVPSRKSELTPSDQAAISAAARVVDTLMPTAEKMQMIQGILTHFNTHYSTHGAHAAAISGQRAILDLELPQLVRRTGLTAMADTQTAAALSRLGAEVSAGTLNAGPLPPDLVALRKTLDTIHQGFPAQPAWSQQGSIGRQLADLSARVPWPATVTQNKTTDDWALDFLLPVIVADHDPKTTDAATNVFNSIVERASAVTQKSARGLAGKTHQRLLDLLAEDHRLWPATAVRQLSLRIADDALTFQENVATGRSHLSAELSEDHRSLLALASRLVALQPSRATEVLAAIDPFLMRRTASGYETAVQEAYALLENDLPPPQLRMLRLTVAGSRINQVIAEHNKLLGSGFQPPEELDDKVRRALTQCYELQSELEPSDEFVKSVQAVRATVIAHYRNLQYQETAAEAIAIKADRQVDWLDAMADFEIAGLRLSIALDDLASLTRQFQGREHLTLTPAVKEAIANFERFVTNRPHDRLVAQVVPTIMLVGKRYQEYEKFEIAAEIYAGLETFAATSEPLQHSKPNTPTVAQRAAFAVATALHQRATKGLKESTESRPDQADPPEELSEEFRAAITAYQSILTNYADSPLLSSAIGKMMEISLQYAAVGAWDVADGVYANLLEQQLPLRQPERLEFARALCEIGKVMPQHAQQMLAAITLWDRDARSRADDASRIAMFERAPSIAGDSLGGGFAGAGMAMAEMAEAPAKTPASASESVATATPATGLRPPADLFGDSGIQSATAGTADEFRADMARVARESDLLAAVRRQQSALASQIAMLRDNEIRQVDRQLGQVPQNGQAQQLEQQTQALAVPVLSEAEISRREKILSVAYAKLQAIRGAYASTPTARQAREQILVLANHWRSIKQWQRSAVVMKRFLADNPTDIELPQLRHEIARDYLAWASGAVKPAAPKQELLDEVNRRFVLAREELSGIIAAFPENQNLKHQTQWDIATSHLSQARVVAGFSSTLARGQFVRAANELLETAELYHDHPKIGELPQMLWSIGQELTQRRFFDEAITVWNEMTLHYPGHSLAEQAALQIAQTYQSQLQLPLRAVESYLELNFARGGNDVELQNSIFQIATRLKNEKRWVEALHVLETFVDSFPQHANAGQALTMIGQVHQTNEVWEDAIAAYRRVILEYDQGNWAQQSKWLIAQCTINLSRWEEAQGAYREYQKAYPEDPKVAEATSRMEVLKDLSRFQKVVDEDGQRKAFDAQYQIATIMRSKLSNPVKAIIEYRKVAERWPDSHLADDALFQVGMIYMKLGQTQDAREAFLATADRYPTSPLADDALFQVGASFEDEAQVLAGVTRGKAIEIASELAQKQAYAVSQGNRRVQRAKNLDQIAQLKKEGKSAEADRQTAFQAALNVAFDNANASVVANWAAQREQALTTAQLADRQDKINAALRKAVASFRRAASVASADKADDALLRMAQIYDQRLKDSDAAMATWLQIVTQYSGTTVAEDASWKIAQYYETHEKYADAIAAYNSFLRNYRRSPKASDAQAAIAENHEQLGNWVEAMDAYTNYINNYPEGSMANKAREQIAWIKTYRL